MSFYSFCFSQETEEHSDPVFIGGKVNLTTKGISNIPNMSLGKRALMLDFMAGKGRWSFDPQFHFDIETYKSWAFMLWGRYKIIQNKKLRMNVGFHPAFIFDKIQTIENGETKNIIRSNRYLAGEYAASYNITKNISIGPYSFIRERSNTRYTLYSFDEWIHKYYSLQRFLYGYQPATVLCKDG